MKRTTIFILLIAILVVFIPTVFGCKKESAEKDVSVEEESTTEDVSEVTEETQEEEQENEITIAVIPLSLGHPWWTRCGLGAEKAGEDLGIEVIFTAPDKEDAAKQLDLFNDMINKGVDAIVLAAVDAETMIQPVNDAIADGIPVFAFDIGVPGSDVLFAATGFEPSTSGKLIGEGIANEIGGEGKVAMLTGTLGSPLLEDRLEAVEEVFNSYDGIEIIGTYANENDYEKALAQAESIIQANPDIKGFACATNGSTPAAAQAVVNAGLEGVAIWGTANPNQVNQWVKDGIVKGAFTLDSGQMTYLGVVMAYRYLVDGTLPKEGDDFMWAGKPLVKVEEKAAYVPDVILTPENVDDFDW